MGVNEMTGTPWHTEYLGLKESDSKRHRAQCIHYYKKKCMYQLTKCTGSSHCDHYEKVYDSPDSKDDQIVVRIKKKAETSIVLKEKQPQKNVVKGTNKVKVQEIKLVTPKKITAISVLRLFNLTTKNYISLSFCDRFIESINEAYIIINSRSSTAKQLYEMQEGTVFRYKGIRYRIDRIL